MSVKYMHALLQTQTPQRPCQERVQGPRSGLGLLTLIIRLNRPRFPGFLNFVWFNEEIPHLCHNLPYSHFSLFSRTNRRPQLMKSYLKLCLPSFRRLVGGKIPEKTENLSRPVVLDRQSLFPRRMEDSDELWLMNQTCSRLHDSVPQFCIVWVELMAMPAYLGEQCRSGIIGFVFV